MDMITSNPEAEPGESWKPASKVSAPVVSSQNSSSLTTGGTPLVVVILAKIWHMGLTQPQKLAHEERIAQVHIRRPLVHSATNVKLLPTLTIPRSNRDKGK